MLPYFIFRMVRRGGYLKDINHRFTVYNQDLKAKIKNKKRLMIHGVSVGEISIALSFIKEYRLKNPNISFIISTNTSTAYQLALNEKDDDDILIYFPIDFILLTKRFIKIIQPQIIILIESELWPNIINTSYKKKIPICLINARISDKSFSSYKKIKFLTSRILPKFSFICVQNEYDIKRFISLGANSNNIFNMGSMKFDLIKPHIDKPIKTLFNITNLNNKIFLLGASTWPKEEEFLIDVYEELRRVFPNLILIIAPRHVERCSYISKLIKKNKFNVIRNSDLEKKDLGKNDILLLDTTGDLLSVYNDVDIVFIGKSLFSRGGQNIIEPASKKCVIITGPYMNNFRPIIDIFDKYKGRYVIRNKQDTINFITKILLDSDYFYLHIENSYNAYNHGRGCIYKTLNKIENCIINSEK